MRDWGTQLRCNQKSPAVSLKHFGVPLCMGNRVSPADDSVIREQHRVVRFHEWQNGLGKRSRAWSFVRRDCHFADENFELGNNQVWGNAPRDGVRGCMRRKAKDAMTA